MFLPKMWPGLDGMFVEPHVAVEVDRKAGDDADTEASDVSDAGSDSDDEPARLPGEAMVEASAARMGKPVSDFEELLAKRREW